MERLGITAAQRHCADILGIKRLPAHRYLGLLCIIRSVHRWPAGEQSRRQHSRGIIAVPFLSLGKVYLKAIEAREVPCRTGERHAHFLIDSPDIPVHTE